MKKFNVDLDLHLQTATETAEYRRQFIMVHRKSQVSKGKVIGINCGKTCQRLRKVLSCASRCDNTDTVFARVICALYFLFWPLKNRGA
jgi:predicted RNA-binding protein YlqC (UPF0109 family)